MTGDERNAVKRIFLEAVERPAADHAAFLDDACDGDADLRCRAQAMLAAWQDAGSFMNMAAVEGAAHGSDAADSSTGAAVSAEASSRKHFAAPRDAETTVFDAAGGIPGAKIGPYKLLERIGEGGFGTVYIADQEQPVRRRVAVKIIKAGMDSRQVIARFEAERQALAMMDHPNIARVLDAGATETGRPYFVMELVRGVPITQYCDDRRVALRERLTLFSDVCHAVQHAHQKGVIHRDLKPSNVLVSRFDDKPVVKIIDFGIAKAIGGKLTDKTVFTELRQMIGTPAYMSPEQAGMSDLDVDTRSDIYSLGVLLYELLTGTTPLDTARLRRADFGELRRIICEEEPPRPSTRISALSTATHSGDPRGSAPGSEVGTQNSALAIAAARQTDPKSLTRLLRGELDWIVVRCLQKDRTRRYDGCSALATDLWRYLAGEPIEAKRDSALYVLRKHALRYRAPIAVCLALMAVLAVGLALTITLWTEARAKAQEASAVTDVLRRILQAPLRVSLKDTPETVLREIAQRASAEIEAGGLGKNPAAEADVRLLLGQICVRISLEAPAKRHTQRALEIREGLFAPGDKRVIEARLAFGDSLHFWSDEDGASLVYREGLARLLEELTTEHTEIRNELQQLATIVRRGPGDQGDVTAFRDLLDECLRLPDDARTALLLSRLPTKYLDGGSLSDATPFLYHAVRISRTLGDKAILAGSLKELGQQLYFQGRQQAAESMLREGIALDRERPGGSETDAGSLEILACLVARDGRLGEAESLRREALAWRRQYQHDDYWETWNAIGELGAVIVRQGRFAEAAPLLLESYANSLKGPAGNPDLNRWPIERIVKLCEAWQAAEPDAGYDAKAAEWRAKLQEFLDKAAADALNREQDTSQPASVTSP